MSPFKKRSLSIAGHRTSIALEQEFWTVLEEIAALRGISLSQLVAETDAGRNDASLSSRLRLLALDHSRRNST